MKQFKLSTGIEISIDEKKLEINRTDGKSLTKGLLAGRTMGRVAIKLSAISSIIQSGDYILICASGIPTPESLKITNAGDIKQYPNCIVGKADELNELYSYLVNLI